MAKKCLANNDGDFADLNPFIFDYLINFLQNQILSWWIMLLSKIKKKNLVYLSLIIVLAKFEPETFQIQIFFFSLLV
jgi:hypothetical protein